MQYSVVGCPKCGHYQLSIAKESFRCRYCGRVLRVSQLKVMFRSSSHSESLSQLYRIQAGQLAGNSG